MGGILVMSVIVSGAVLTIWGWARWLRARSGHGPTWRSGSAFAGLIALSIACAAFLGLVVYASGTGGFGDDPSIPLFFARISIYLCLAALASSNFGKGACRLPVLLAALALGLLWVMVAATMP
jgi:hypothetical protein